MPPDRNDPVELAVCVVNFNGERYLDGTLAALFEQEPAPGELLLVDNASTDRSLGMVRERFPAVRVITLEENRGPGAARNAGFREAAFDRVLFVDNDVILAPGCADALTKALDAEPRAAAAMPRVLYADRLDLIQYDGAECHALGLMALHHADRPEAEVPDGTRRIGSLVTACFLFDRSRWQGGQPFDESFFFNLEDHDLGVRLRLAGLEILSVPAARCYHGGGTEGLSLRHGGTYSPVRVECLIRNRWQVILKSYRLRTLIVLAPMLVLYEFFQFAGVLLRGWLKPWIRALAWTATHTGEIRRKRRAVQRLRVTPDSEVLHGGPVPLREELTERPWQRRARSLLDRLVAGYWSLARRLI